MNTSTNTKKALVIGHGYVGQAYAALLARKYAVELHDPQKGLYASPAAQQSCSLAVVCVPTPSTPDGACDTTIVESVVQNLPRIRCVLIKSTVTPGTTEALAARLDRPLMYSPEYIGEGGYWTPQEFPHPTDPLSHGFMTIGTSSAAHAERLDETLIDLMMPIVGPSTRFRVMSSTEAELAKYFENVFLATKITFVNEMRRVCVAAGARYHAVREGWLDDARIGTSHSAAFVHKPTYDGKCLPKDTAALARYCASLGVSVPLLAQCAAAGTATGDVAK